MRKLIVRMRRKHTRAVQWQHPTRHGARYKNVERSEIVLMGFCSPTSSPGQKNNGKPDWTTVFLVVARLGPNAKGGNSYRLSVGKCSVPPIHHGSCGAWRNAPSRTRRSTFFMRSLALARQQSCRINQAHTPPPYPRAAFVRTGEPKGVAAG